MNIEEVKFETLVNYEFESLFCAQHGRGLNKKLSIRVKDKRVEYIVYNKKEEVFSSPSAKKALDVYNKIRR